jgi:hypothetical protein
MYIGQSVAEAAATEGAVSMAPGMVMPTRRAAAEINLRRTANRFTERASTCCLPD